MPAVTRTATRRAALAEDNEQGESHRDEPQGHRDEPHGQEVKLRESHRVEVPQGHRVEQREGQEQVQGASQRNVMSKEDVDLILMVILFYWEGADCLPLLGDAGDWLPIELARVWEK